MVIKLIKLIPLRLLKSFFMQSLKASSPPAESQQGEASKRLLPSCSSRSFNLRLELPKLTKAQLCSSTAMVGKSSLSATRKFLTTSLPAHSHNKGTETLQSPLALGRFPTGAELLKPLPSTMAATERLPNLSKASPPPSVEDSTCDPLKLLPQSTTVLSTPEPVLNPNSAVTIDMEQPNNIVPVGSHILSVQEKRYENEPSVQEQQYENEPSVQEQQYENELLNFQPTSNVMQAVNDSAAMDFLQPRHTSNLMDQNATDSFCMFPGITTTEPPTTATPTTTSISFNGPPFQAIETEGVNNASSLFNFSMDGVSSSIEVDSCSIVCISHFDDCSYFRIIHVAVERICLLLQELRVLDYLGHQLDPPTLTCFHR